MWKTLTGIRIPDILQFVADASRDGQAVHIGTDSLQTGRFMLAAVRKRGNVTGLSAVSG